MAIDPYTGEEVAPNPRRGRVPIDDLSFRDSGGQLSNSGGIGNNHPVDGGGNVNGGGGNWWDPGGSSGNQVPNAPPQLSDNYWQDFFRQQYGQLQPIPAYNTSQQDASRRMQDQVIQGLQAQAAGSKSTRAQQELAGQNRAGQQSQYALASTQRGIGAGAQLRQGRAGAGQVAAALGGQSEALKLQEQQQAQAALAQLYAQQHAQDLALAQDQSQYSLQGQALQDAMQQFYAGQGSAGVINRDQNQMDLAGASLGFGLEDTKFARENAQAIAGMAGAGLGTLSEVLRSSGGGGASNASRGAGSQVTDMGPNSGLGDYFDRSGGFA